jgi:hypothetical protein
MVVVIVIIVAGICSVELRAFILEVWSVVISMIVGSCTADVMSH